MCDTCVVIDAGGAPGNKCHVDCSEQGVCDTKTGICKCFKGYVKQCLHYQYDIMLYLMLLVL
jgi:EGF-like domain